MRTEEHGWIWNLADGETFVKLKKYSEGPIGRRLWSKEPPMYKACGLEAIDDIDHLNDNYATITLSFCSFLSEFTCNNGECIDKYKRCDDNLDCADHSDEDLCTIVEVDKDYRSGEPPALVNQINNVTTTIRIKRFDNIYLDGTMEITLSIEMTWTDDKLTYLNIKDDGSQNTTNSKDVSIAKQSKLWLPLDRIVHENAVIGEIHPGSNSYVRVIASSEPTSSLPINPTEGKRKGVVSLNLIILRVRCPLFW